MDPDEAEILDVDGTLAIGEEVDDDEGEDDDDVDDTAVYVSAVDPAGVPPRGFKFMPCPDSLEDDDDLLALVGEHVYVAWDAPNIIGWFVGQVVARGVSHRDLKTNPSANVVVAYDKRVTMNKYLHGRVASTLTTKRFGASQWWILLEKV
jgi:hypothetical protein